jgi:hypothetical protein
MSSAFYLISQVDDGESSAGEVERERCLYDLDRAIIDGTPGGARDFLSQWGEPLRDLLKRHDTNLVTASQEGKLHAA